MDVSQQQHITEILTDKLAYHGPIDFDSVDLEDFNLHLKSLLNQRFAKTKPKQFAYKKQKLTSQIRYLYDSLNDGSYATNINAYDHKRIEQAFKKLPTGHEDTFFRDGEDKVRAFFNLIKKMDENIFGPSDEKIQETKNNASLLEKKLYSMHDFSFDELYQSIDDSAQALGITELTPQMPEYNIDDKNHLNLLSHTYINDSPNKKRTSQLKSLQQTISENDNYKLSKQLLRILRFEEKQDDLKPHLKNIQDQARHMLKEKADEGYFGIIRSNVYDDIVMDKIYDAFIEIRTILKEHR